MLIPIVVRCVVGELTESQLFQCATLGLGVEEVDYDDLGADHDNIHDQIPKEEGGVSLRDLWGREVLGQGSSVRWLLHRRVC